MPGSSEKGKRTIEKWFKIIPDKKLVLDVGPGWGTYNKLLRENGQVWHAVEIHKPYIKRFELEKLYENIFNEDIRKFAPPQHYDVTICGDVLEHIEIEAAVQVLKKLLHKSEYLIVSLPLDAETNAPPGTGDKDWDNPNEMHVGKWSHQLFIDTIKGLGGSIIAEKKFHEIAVYLIGPKESEALFSFPNKYTVVCICQIFNELDKGNLERFVKYVRPLADLLVVYDDGSTDGSYEYMLKQTPFVIRGDRNDFLNEIDHKQKLLDYALKLNPDFIFYLDADEVFTENACTRLQELCLYCIEHDLDGLSFRKLNLWRSASWRRIDSSYDDGWFVHLWRVRPGMSYGEINRGLHQPPYPPMLQKIERVDDVQVIHYGFSSKKQLAYKYLVYRLHGQRGYNMLDRLISEETLMTEKVPKELFPEDLWSEDEKPQPLSFTESLSGVEQYREEVFRPRFSIICLIYKSIDWLKFVYEQILKYTDMTDKEFFFVANDANDAVLKYLHDNYIPHYISENSSQQKSEWYINNVYRAYNFSAKKAKGDFLVFINSDMAFTPGWFDNLWKAYNGANCVASRLVESGKLKSGLYGIEKDFGRNHDSYLEMEFQQYAASAALTKVKNGGLFMPLLIRKQHFFNVGGYPEGNISPESDIFKPVIAKSGDPTISGDNVLMKRLQTQGVAHQTAFDSIVYHFQCGELDSTKTNAPQSADKKIAVCNDIVTGSMGEKVLWDFLLEFLPLSVGVDTRVVGKEGSYSKNARINRNHPAIRVIIQNATFIGTVDETRYTIAFLQDDLRAMNRTSIAQERNLQLARKLVTNSITTALSYPEHDFEIIPVGVDSTLFAPMNKSEMRKEFGFADERVGIFVGNFSEVKGWAKVRECIEHFPEIKWILVSKYDESFSAPNVRVYNRISQQLLARLLNCADFFIIGSPVETQCLAAVEACLCDIPVIMQNVGIFTQFTEEERSKIGLFGGDFFSAIREIPYRTFSPRRIIIAEKLTLHDSMYKWNQLLARVSQELMIEQSKPSIKTNPNKISKLRFRLEFSWKYGFLSEFPLISKINISTLKSFIKNRTPLALYSKLSKIWRFGRDEINKVTGRKS
jgi:glycosyltransferase involved in cell wall biosynthesis